MAPDYRDDEDESARPLLGDFDPTDEEAATAAFRSPWQDAPRAAARHDIPEASTADSEDLHIRTVSPEPLSPVRVTSIPIWLREAAPSFRWGWIPVPIRHAARRIVAWTDGPQPRQIQRIQPWFPSVQELPLRLVERWLPKRRHRASALLILYVAWALTFGLVILHSARSGDIAGYGKPMDIWCGASFWDGAKPCGLDGNNCRPFTNASLAFRCNANCASVELLTPYMFGDKEIIYTPLVIGGGDEDGIEPVYRGDSFICQAAVHAGIVSNTVGGCGILHLTGAATEYIASDRNGITSYGFDSYFPKSFTLEATSMEECGTVDMRWPLLGVTMTFTIIISLFTTSPAVFFWSVLLMLFVHVGLVSDKPNIASYIELISLLLGRFLPAAFTAYVLYRAAARPQLAGLTAQVEKTILYLGGAWVGALSNYTFSFIPLQRLTPHDLKQPGAVLSLILICTLLFVIACGQVYSLRQEGLLRRYLAIYGLMAIGLIIGVALPPLSLRIHHYILALLLIPGTRPQTRPGLLYQGLLLGLYINGTARWGFASILQTAAALRGGGPDGPETTSPVPLVNATVDWVGNMAKGISFTWSATQLPEGTDGVSVVVNDVERHRWYVGEGAPSWFYQRAKGQGHWWGSGDDVREYFRFGFLAGSDALEYSAAGIWEGNGTWRGFIGEGEKGEGDGGDEDDGGEL